MKLSTLFPTEEIDQQARRVLTSPLFKNSPVLSRFLEFIIAETVHKREMQIKEYSIAINVLNRSPNFNPNVDSIVRIHAGRLRRALNEYYLTQGIYDPIVIQIPKGCYVPEFFESGTIKPTVKKFPPSAEPGNKPLVAIFPFRAATYGDDIQEALLVFNEQLSEQLLSFPGIAVIAYYSDEMKAKIKENVLEAGKSAGADYIITGSLTYLGEHMRVLISLLVTSTGEVLLCKSFGKNILYSDFVEIIKDIVRNFTGFSGDCYGMIFPGWKKYLAQEIA